MRTYVAAAPAAWYALFPDTPEFAVERVTGIIVHGLCAVLLAALTWRIWKDARAALFAGAGFSLYVPVALAVVGKAFFATCSERLRQGPGPPSRTNFVILPFLFILPAFLFTRRSHMIRRARQSQCLSCFSSPR